MKAGIRGEGSVERIGLALNRAPVPLLEMMWGMGVSRGLIAAARLGVLARLGRGPATAAEIAEECGLHLYPARLMLDATVAAGHLVMRGERYAFSRRSRKWLDPGSPTSIVGFLENGADFWTLWSHLEEVMRTGKSFDIHNESASAEQWRRYITAQHQLARLSAAEVARRLVLPARPHALLDAAGGHGWYAAELCRRHQTLRATVVDLPPSADIGREIISAAGMSAQVTHLDGDVFSADLGGPYDAALCCNFLHHCSAAQAAALIARIGAVLVPGGVLAVLDMFRGESPARSVQNAGLGLFFYLASGTETHSVADLAGWLAAAGFSAPKGVSVRSLPLQSLYRAQKVDRGGDHPQA